MNTIIKITKYCALAICSLFILSCATTLHELDRGARPEEGMAYIFGRFHQPNAAVELKLIMFNINTEKEFAIPIYGYDFLKGSSDYVKVIALQPGIYHLIRFDASFSSYGSRRRMSTSRSARAPIDDKRYLTPFTLKAGQLGYIGDVTGRSRRSRIRGASFGVKIFDHYNRDIKQLEKRYPTFMSLEIVELFRISNSNSR